MRDYGFTSEDLREAYEYIDMLSEMKRKYKICINELDTIEVT